MYLSQVILVATFLQNSVFSFELPSVTTRLKTPKLESCPVSVAEVIASVSLQIQRNLLCGSGNWTQVADLDMSDPLQNCPPPWVFRTAPPRTSFPGRSCATSKLRCSSVYFNTSGVTYQSVCGMAIGYALGSPDAFYRDRVFSINYGYLDGVSITHGRPRQHIWSLAVGHSTRTFSIYRCPCDNPHRGQAPLPPSFVGENYFCDSDHIQEEVWDGNCTSSCCSFHSPPWFKTLLLAPTTDHIEVRICQDQWIDDEQVLLKSLALFVQL